MQQATIHQNEIKKGRQKKKTSAKKTVSQKDFERTKIPKEIGED